MLAALRWSVLAAVVLPAALAQGPAAQPGATPAPFDSLPLPFDYWAIYQALKPSAVAEPLRLGGLSASKLPLASREAASWTYSGYILETVPVSDPYQPGRPLFLADPAAIETSDGKAPASWLTRPVHPETAIRFHAPGRRWHGTAGAFLTGAALAGDNRSPPDIGAGLLRPEKFRWYSLNRIAAGGPLGKRAALTLSAAGRWAEQTLPRRRNGANLDTRLLTGAARAHFRTNSLGRFAAGIAASGLRRSGYGLPAGFEALAWRRAAPPFRPHPLLPENDRFASFDIAWTPETALDSSLEALDLRYGFARAHLETPPATAASPARIELLDGSSHGPPPLANRASRSRHHVAFSVALRPFRTTSAAPEISAGFSWTRSGARNRWSAPADTHQIVVRGAPSTVVFLNTPLDSRTRGDSAGAYLAVSARLTKAFRLSGGVRLDHRRAGLPAQSSPAGAHWPARNFPSAGPAIQWTTISPRAAFSLRLPGPASLVLRGAYGRFQQPLGLYLAGYANPNALSGLEYRWRDAGGDGLWQPGETGTLLRRFGGLYSTIDPALRSPYAEEIRAALSGKLPGGVRAALEGFRRDYRRRLAARNIGVPFDLPSGAPSYRPVEVPDPGPDGLPGTLDDRRLAVYEQSPATFGRDRFLLSNAGADAFSAGFTARLSGSGSSYAWQLSFTVEKGYGTAAFGNDAWQNDPGLPGTLFHDPNELIHAAGRFFFDRAYLARALAFWRLPKRTGGFEIGLAAAYFDGLPFARRLLIEGLAQGSFVVMATPRGSPEGGHRTEFNLSLDLRVARRFEAGPGKLRLTADVFNLPNLGLNLRERDLTGPAFNQRLPLAIQPPRFLRLGLEYRF